ncbi:MAG: enoyl-CoA hydratase/isomerase family protein [Gammaproteobacteria bacterium]|nr:enoyl-CoA hydratase/isomerase family protein [Gammaproteobacteria bacterium]
MPDFKTIRYQRAGTRATITLNRPEHLNGITNTMMRELHECVSAVAADPDIRVVELTGAGRGFCPGADLKAFSSGEPQEPNRKEYFQITAMLHEMPKVTVAAINGACAGAGFGWACACDLRYAASSATFNTAFLGVAISGDMAGPWLLPRILGATKARELYFMPGKFGAEEALRIGLVARTFADAAFRDEVAVIMERLAQAAPLAIGEMKKNFVNAESMSLRDYIDLETERHGRTGASEDSKEAFRAFVEKRPPRFVGR